MQGLWGTAERRRDSPAHTATWLLSSQAMTVETGKPTTEAAEGQAEAVPEEGHAAAGEGACAGQAAAAGWQERTGQAAAQEEEVPGAAAR